MFLPLSTERFLLRCLTSNDATERYLLWLQSPSADFIINKASEVIQLATYIESHTQNEHTMLLGIFEKRTLLHIGNIKFEFLNAQQSIVEMGILIGDINWQGIGVAGEVISAMGDYFRDHFNTHKMVLGVDKDNIAAIKAYQKIGFSEELEPLSVVDATHGMLMAWNLRNH